MGTITSLFKKVDGSTRNDFFAEFDECLNDFFQVHQFRLAPVQGQHVNAKRRLQRGKAEQLVQNHVGIGITFKFDHHAYA